MTFSCLQLHYEIDPLFPIPFPFSLPPYPLPFRHLLCRLIWLCFGNCLLNGQLFFPARGRLMEVQLCRSFYLSEVTYLSTSPQGSNLPCSWVAVSLKYLLNRFLYDTTLALISSGTLSFTVGRALLARGRLCEGPPSWVPLLKELWVDERSSVDAGRKERCTVVSVCCWFKVAWPNRLNKALVIKSF